MKEPADGSYYSDSHEEVHPTMSYRLTPGAALAVVLLLGGTAAAEELKSGPQVGQTIPGAFSVLNVTGESAGEKACLV
jgi:hypothetical protein